MLNSYPTPTSKFYRISSSKLENGTTCNDINPSKQPTSRSWSRKISNIMHLLFLPTERMENYCQKYYVWRAHWVITTFQIFAVLSVFYLHCYISSSKILSDAYNNPNLLCAKAKYEKIVRVKHRMIFRWKYYILRGTKMYT